MNFPTLADFLEGTTLLTAADTGSESEQAMKDLEKGAEKTKDDQNASAVKNRNQEGQRTGIVVAEDAMDQGRKSSTQEISAAQYARLFAGLKTESLVPTDPAGHKEIKDKNGSAEELYDGGGKNSGSPVLSVDNSKSASKQIAKSPVNVFALHPVGESAEYVEAMAKASALAAELSEALAEAGAIAETTVSESRHIVDAIAKMAAESAVKVADEDGINNARVRKAKETLSENSNWMNFSPPQDISAGEFGKLEGGREYRATTKIGNMQNVWDPVGNVMLSIPCGFLIGIPGYSA